MLDPSLKGHLPQRRRLMERLQEGRLPGSLLLAGPEAIGKRRVALELPQRELCFRRTACGICEGCRPFRQDPLPVELPNLLRIAPEGKAGLIKVGMVRGDDLVEGGVVAWAHQAALPGTHRWILVEDAHRLNGPSANMLLKVLEEPPPGAHFLLVTHRPDAMLQTIRSRCERIAFSPLGPDEAWAVACSEGWEPSEQARWSALAGGSLRYLEADAFARAVDQLEAWLALGQGAPFAATAGPLLPDKEAVRSQGEQVAEALELLLRVLSDVARIREGRAPRLAPWQEGLGALAQGPLALKPPQEAAHRALRHLLRNPSPEALLREVALALRG